MRRHSTRLIYTETQNNSMSVYNESRNMDGVKTRRTKKKRNARLKADKRHRRSRSDVQILSTISKYRYFRFKTSIYLIRYIDYIDIFILDIDYIFQYFYSKKYIFILYTHRAHVVPQNLNNMCVECGLTIDIKIYI